MNYPAGTAYIDGAFVPMSEAKISVLDWGFLHSDATYDVVHVWKGRFFRLDSHIERFARSADRLRLTLPVSPGGLARILAECVARSGLEDAYVEMVLTRGTSPTFSRDLREARNQLICFAIPFGWILKPEQREAGLSIVLSDIRRIPPESVDPTVKNYHWLDFVMGLYDAYDRGAQSAVLTDAGGNLAEGPGFNIFTVRQGRIATPDRGVLRGVTRQTAIDLAAELGFPLEERVVAAAEALAADEVFVTSTAGGIMPVTRINAAVVGEGRMGPVTRALLEAYWARHEDPAWSTAVADVASADPGAGR
ncbi:branched-chain amino acid transferase [Labrys sp. WJW]|uniref:aminotransferase class IV n=1 Tax=Labrys sp. WJW TaxID=1737983 RepID=UPI000835D8D4|nr:aminotransferase class IV [Labrys sp. WJW]OCC02416.1 branched-chain amino acid transferase [Labrys sp. WJW]